MDSDLKKQIGILALTILIGFSWYLTDMIPEITLTGRTLTFLVLVVGAIVHFVEWMIGKYTGAHIDDISVSIPGLKEEKNDSDTASDEDHYDESDQKIIAS